MASLTWAGGVSTDAGDPKNWSGGVLPKPGDSLVITGGTIDVFDDEMAGNTINVENGSSATTRPPVVFNIHNNGFLDQNLLDSVTSIGPITFNVDATATWSGGYGSTLSPVTVNGSGLWENGMSGMNGSTALVNPAVIGSGQFFVLSAHGQDGVLEFKSAVSDGQAVAVAGNPEDGSIATLVLDDPLDFAGSITLQYGEIALNGITADSYSYDGSTLNLLSGNRVVDSLRINEVAPTNGANGPLSVTLTANGIDIHNDGPGVTPMPTPTAPDPVAQNRQTQTPQTQTPQTQTPQTQTPQNPQTAQNQNPQTAPTPPTQTPQTPQDTPNTVDPTTVGSALRAAQGENQLSFISPTDGPAADPTDTAANNLGQILDDQGVPVNAFAITSLGPSGVFDLTPDPATFGLGADFQSQPVLLTGTDPTALPLAA